MAQFQVGYAFVNINPPLGCGIHGYYIPRFAKGFLDDLEAHGVVLSMGEKKIAMISVDSCELMAPIINRYRAAIEKATGIPAQNLFISCTHTHTGPLIQPTDAFEAPQEPIDRYADFVEERLIDLVKLAVMDLKPARMGFITGYAPERVAYIRLYRMKDGTTMTCPPINDPNIDGPSARWISAAISCVSIRKAATVSCCSTTVSMPIPSTANCLAPTGPAGCAVLWIRRWTASSACAS